MKRSILYLVVALALCIFIQRAEALTLTFNTFDSQFTSGVDNQGWWSSTITNSDNNVNYITGNVGSGSDELRSFFSFDLASLTSGLDVVTSARLELKRFGSSINNEATETLGFFDVSTPAATLNHNVGTSAAIFADLGSGASYGSFVVPGSGAFSTVLSFNLNTSAITDLNSSLGGFFSVGGSLLSQSGNDWLFGASNASGIQRLVLEVSQPIPEPGAFVLLSAGLVALFGYGRRRKKRSA